MEITEFSEDCTDEQIVALCGQNPDNYRYLIIRYRQYLINFLLKNFNLGRSDAEDIAQDALTKAFLHLSRFNIKKKWKTWLFQIAVNQARSFKRKPQVYQLEDFKDRFIGGEEYFKKDIFLDRIYDAINLLGPYHRKLINLYYIEGLSLKEISTKEKIRISIVKTGLAQAEKNLVAQYYLHTNFKQL